MLEQVVTTGASHQNGASNSQSRVACMSRLLMLVEEGQGEWYTGYSYGGVMFQL